jgi:hypothetical protein
MTAAVERGISNAYFYSFVFDVSFKGHSGSTALFVQWRGNPRSDIPSTSSNRWPQLRGGADASLTVVMPPAPASQNIGVGLRQLSLLTFFANGEYKLD